MKMATANHHANRYYILSNPIRQTVRRRSAICFRRWRAIVTGPRQHLRSPSQTFVVKRFSSSTFGNLSARVGLRNAGFVRSSPGLGRRELHEICATTNANESIHATFLGFRCAIRNESGLVAYSATAARLDGLMYKRCLCSPEPREPNVALHDTMRHIGAASFAPLRHASRSATGRKRS